MAKPKKSSSALRKTAPRAKTVEEETGDYKAHLLSGYRGWLLLSIVLIGAALLILVTGRHVGDVEKVGDAIVKATKNAGKPSIGGPFELTDHKGNQVSNKTYIGKYMLVYFGFTYCPDICPTGLTEISNALGLLGGDADNIVPIFISVDPGRDTPEHLREYVAYFHPRLVGLTGTEEQVSAVARAYRVYFAKVENKGPGADPEDYSVDHSALIYLMGPDGLFLQHFGHATSAEQMVKQIKEIIKP